MKKKYLIFIIFVFVSIISLINLGLNINFLVTKPPKMAGDIFYKSKDSVVEIKAETDSVGTSYGTAIIIDKDGTMITNAHVITYKNLGETYTFENISVRFVDEENYRNVTILKYDIEKDIAVIKLNETNRTINPIKLGNDSTLETGDTVYAIGNMSNYGLSMTIGIVAIPHINVSYNEVIRMVIQCDLTISDGNSGGALINRNGELVGLTTFRLKDQTNNIIYGISYCIPINTVMEYIKK